MNERRSQPLTEAECQKLLRELGDDPVAALLLTGQAQTLHEAEEMYLNASLSEIERLAGSDLTNEELEKHPLIRLLLSHGSRGWEDSLL